MGYVSGINERETGFINFLIFENEIKHILIHIELNISQRNINAWLVRKEEEG